MQIKRIDQTLERCEEHLSSTSAYGTEIESLLTQSLLVTMYAEFERKIAFLVRERCSSVTDASIKAFIESSINAVLRNLRSDGIAGLLKRFGTTHRETFTHKTKDNQRAVTLYNNIVTNRHQVAHKEGSKITFSEAKQFYEEGHVVLDFFREALLTKDYDGIKP